ncbi:unnamed protein product [Calicophoron daubneyi]|uniref:Yippee domain-containing protein n=1 Tax=Calicophoron daubneyi TaxID=300641 RepID=A0AAV2SZF2_CALDB
MVKGQFQEYLPEKQNSWTYSCLYCRAHLARHEDLISKSFQGSQGRAYLFDKVVNVDFSEAKQRVLLTGIHFVADVYCACCNNMIGWKYERAFEPSQRYKEGKVIVELAHLIKNNGWDTEWLGPVHRSSSLPFSSTARSGQSADCASARSFDFCRTGAKDLKSALSCYISCPHENAQELNYPCCSPSATELNSAASSSIGSFDRHRPTNHHLSFFSPPARLATHEEHFLHIFSSKPVRRHARDVSDPDRHSILQASNGTENAHPSGSDVIHGAIASCSTGPVKSSHGLLKRGRFALLPTVQIMDPNDRNMSLPLCSSSNSSSLLKNRGLRRSRFRRRASSSSPSRAFLLPFGSEDELEEVHEQRLADLEPSSYGSLDRDREIRGSGMRPRTEAS